MDEIIRKALKRIRELDQEKDRLNEFIRTYEELNGSKIQRDEMLSSGDKWNYGDKLSSKDIFLHKKRNDTSKILAATQRLIREAERPLTRGEVAEGLDRLNVPIHATDVPKYIGTLLWRNSELFTQIEGEGYGLKGVDYQNDTVRTSRNYDDDDLI